MSVSVWTTQVIQITALFLYLIFIVMCCSILGFNNNLEVCLWVTRKASYKLTHVTCLLKPCEVFNVETGNNCTGFYNLFFWAYFIPKFVSQRCNFFVLQHLAEGTEELCEELQTTWIHLFFLGLFSDRQFSMHSSTDTFIHWMTSVLHTASSLSPFSCAGTPDCRIYTAAGRKW